MTTYHINFNTDTPAPGYITSTKIVISKVVTKDKGAKFNAALCDDPLYPALVRYVLDNTLKKRQRNE